MTLAWQAPRRSRLAARRAGALFGLFGLLGCPALGACAAPTTVPPIAPSLIELTPVAGIGGIAYTATPTAGPSATSTIVATVVVPPAEPLDLAPNVVASEFAAGLGPARAVAVAPDGVVMVAIARENRILALPDRDADGRADHVLPFGGPDGYNHPSDLAFGGGHLWIANTDGIARVPYEPGDVAARTAPQMVVPLPEGGRNPDRSVALDGAVWLYIGVGGSCNACPQADVRQGAVLRLAVDGTSAAVYARGLRAPYGLAVHPDSGEVWATDQARDDRGDDGPSDELDRLIPGGDYGWPECFGDRRADLEFGAGRERCLGSIGPVLELPPHQAPSGMAFHNGRMFPEDWHGDLLVAYFGSSTASLPTGHRVVRLPFDAGEPTGQVVDVASGWLRRDTRRWGRPADVAVAPDGAIYVADEAAGRVYRLTYMAPVPTATPPF